MQNPIAGQPGEEDASAEAPVVTAADIEKVRKEMDERIIGFQKLVSAREEEAKALRQELEDERLSGLSEDERADIVEAKKDKRIAELEAQIELSTLAGDYGSEMPYFQRLLAAESAEDQLKTMREFATSLATAKAESAPVVNDESDEVEVPDVDLNRPLRGADETFRFADGSGMTDAQADRLLAQATGPLAAYFKRQ